MKLYQGTASGKTVVDVKGPSPVTDLQLHLDRVQVHPLLKDLAGKDFLEGTAKAQMTLSMTGDDPARIKQTLGGKGSFVVSDGAVIGVDLAGMARNVKAALGGEVKSGPKPRTDFAELLVPFTIDNGVAHTSETTLKSPLLRLLAAGKADLVKETLDFRVDTKLVGTIRLKYSIRPCVMESSHPAVRRMSMKRYRWQNSWLSSAWISLKQDFL